MYTPAFIIINRGFMMLEWITKQIALAKERGDEKAVRNYEEMYELWERRVNSIGEHSR